jgi:glycosyltransferase involved in cell wall biosynthesis
MDKKLRIMLNSNAPYAPSGYGQQVRQFLPLIAKEGYPTACINFFGLEGGIINLDGITMYPRIASQWGDDAMLNHSKHFNADVVFTLQDIWTLDVNTLKQLATNKKRWIPIVPIDHEPVPPAIKERLNFAYRIVSYAPFGEKELKRQGMHSTYIPHTVETDIFKKMDKSEIRKGLGIPDDVFLFGMVAANKDMPPRKSFQEVMDAFARFHKEHPKSAIYFHTLTKQAGGFPIEEYAKVLGISDVIYHVEPYEQLYLIDAGSMARVYNSFDCLLIPSQNEGFGVPIIEAMACEVPVITTDFTAMRDLVEDGKTGYKVKVERKRFTPLLSYVAVPDVDDLYKKMEKMYETDREKMGKAGRKFVVENFDLNVVWERHWKPFLSKLEKEVYPQVTIPVKEKIEVS